MKIAQLLRYIRWYRAMEAYALCAYRAGDINNAMRYANVCHFLHQQTPVRYRYLLSAI